MGMFDIIKCEYELPLPKELGECHGLDWEEIEFQTKAFGWEASQDKYSITEDGQLYLEKVERSWSEDESHPFGGEMEEKPDGIEKQEYTGEIDFYHVHMGEEHDYWIEFKATFWKGDLKEIESVEWKKENNSKRIEVQNNIQKRINKQFRKQNKWYYKVYYKFFRFIFTIIGWILQGVVAFLAWLERKILG